MARLVYSGFEAQSSVDGGGAGAGTFDTAIFRSGLVSAKLDSGGGGISLFASLSAVPTGLAIPNSNATYNWFLRGYFYFVAWPASTVCIIQMQGWGSDTGTQHGVSMDSTGHLIARVDAGSASSASSQVVSLNEWHRIEVSLTVVVIASTSRQITVNDIRLDGVPLGLTSTYTHATVAPGASTTRADMGWNNAPGTNKVVYVDDAAWNNDSGGSQNSWPDEGRVVLLKPISDNARATLWTGGSGGTTNLWDAVDNTPPVGTATETNTTQIEHAGGAAGSTDAYDANMTSYTSAGLGPTAVVRVVSMCAADGEDITTGTKLLAYSVVSNPAIASPGNVSAGDDVGLLGTYSSNWARRALMGVTYDPVVTPQTSPVMRVVRPETASRVASVCFMGLNVEYQDGPWPSRPKVAHYPQLLAH